MSKPSISKLIRQIGEKMVSCPQGCEGASASFNGTPPRCLYLEEDLDTEDGVIVVGLNPGKAKKSELEFYNNHGLTYASTCDYLRDGIAGIKYYARVKALLKRIGLTGSILWTEVAKCELLITSRDVTLDMQRNCTRLYLSRELVACPRWPVVATGRVAFKAVSLLAADRPVIGVPHPTGARGNSFDTATGNTAVGLSDRQRKAIASALASNKAIWLGNDDV